MADDILSRIAAMDAQLASLQRDVQRLEPGIQRIDDNIDNSRHSINNGVQVIANEVGTIRLYLNNLARDMAPVIILAQEVKEAKSQASGAGKAITWISPLISALIAVAAVGYATYKGVP